MRYLRTAMRHPARRNGTLLALVFGAIGCSALDVSSPLTTRFSDVQDPDGAHMIFNGIFEQVNRGLAYALISSGEITDEFKNCVNGEGCSADTRDLLENKKWLEDPNNFTGSTYETLQTAWVNSTIAISQIRKNGTAADLSETYALRGLIMQHLGEVICPGFPISNMKINGEVITPVFDSDPQTEDSAFARVLVDADSALAYAPTAGRVNSFAKVLRARALLGLGRFAEAATAAADVDIAFADTIKTNSINSNTFQYTVADTQGTNGLNFVSANDPRAVFVDAGVGGGFVRPAKFGTSNIPGGTPLIVASGVEARLIEAESMLATSGDWLGKINQVRATFGMSDTTDPGNNTARLNLIMHERAFTLYATGHRLGDFRRMMKLYGRDSETLFPTGILYSYTNDLGNVITAYYGTLKSIPFNAYSAHQLNPKITGCLDQ